ncbi:unnamed protein product [Lymnaea stagnalis]|uniref:G-protein coupled receptors family 1 profile domain-containing protein n=1 Tax=Lymnaea stagnalis TaxID=6523 RepID=A0AAV2IF30_LYMST
MLVALVRSILRDGRILTTNNSVITRILMSSLAFSDTMTGTIVMTFGIVEISNNGKWMLGGRVCTFRLAVNNLLCAVSLYHVLCMAVDRFLAVCRPMTYRLLTSRHAYLMVLLAWGFPAVLVVLPEAAGLHHIGVEDKVHCNEINHLCGSIYNTPALFLIFPFAFYVPLLLTYVLYVMILIEIKQFHERDPRNVVSNANRTTSFTKSAPFNKTTSSSIENRTTTSRDSGTSTRSESSCSNVTYSKSQTELYSDLPDLRVTSNRPTDRSLENEIHFISKHGAASMETVPGNNVKDSSSSSKKINRSLKAYRTIGCIVVCCTVCWVPTWITVLLFIYDLHFMPIIGVIGLLWLAYSNAGLNPVIYCFNKSVRRAVRAMLR